MTLISCGGHSKLKPTQQPPLEPDKEQVWQLVCMQNRSLDRSGAAVTLVLNPEAGTATGQTTCNEYTFSYTLSKPTSHNDGDLYPVSFTFWGSGNIMCPESDMNAERRYLSLLTKATHMKIGLYTLILYQQNKEILRFELQD